jgi:hypothetical protein
MQFEVASEDDIFENEANIPMHENIACIAEGILEDILMGTVQGTSLDNEQEVEVEEVYQQLPNPPPSHSEALKHVLHASTCSFQVSRAYSNLSLLDTWSTWSIAGSSPIILVQRTQGVSSFV